MQTTTLLLASLAAIGAIANTLPTRMGIEVLEENGRTIVREVPRALGKRSCTNCVHVGGECTIGEGNCYSTEHASCTDCGNGRVICVDTDGGSCAAP